MPPSTVSAGVDKVIFSNYAHTQNELGISPLPSGEIVVELGGGEFKGLHVDPKSCDFNALARHPVDKKTVFAPSVAGVETNYEFDNKGPYLATGLKSPSGTLIVR